MNKVIMVLKQKIMEAKKEKYRKELQEKENMKLATSVMAEISGIISKIQFGKKEDLQTLLQLKNKYEKLGVEVRKFLDYSLIDKLDDLIVQAQIDQENNK